MSLAPYPSVLYWVGLRGVARHDGREVRLSAPPHLPELRIDGIDYRPGAIAQVMPYADRWRDMTPAECEAARVLLNELTHHAIPHA